MSKSPSWGRDASLIALFATLLRLPALYSKRILSFDDGQYGATALALRDGERPYLDVFSSQGPLHHRLIYLFDLLGFRTPNAPRLMTVASGIAATLAAYAIGRRVTTRGRAILAAVLVTTSGSMLLVTGPIGADGPALALASTAVALAWVYSANPSAALAAMVGLALGAGVSVKALAAPAAIPVAMLLLSRRRWRDVALAACAAFVVALATVIPAGLDLVWEQSVAYHLHTRRIRTLLGNLRAMGAFLVRADPFVLATLAVSAGALAWTRLRGPRATTADAPETELQRARVVLGAWLAAQLALLIYDPAMWRTHVAHLIVPLALLATLCPAPLKVLAPALLLVAPLWFSESRALLWPTQVGKSNRLVIELLRQLPPRARVVTDDTGLAWRAGRRVPGMLVDTSVKRVRDHQITANSVAEAAKDPRVCAVLVWSKRVFLSFDTLPELLARGGYEATHRFRKRRILYTRSDCAP